MDIIIFCGQSNMQGQTEQLTSTEPIPNAFEYRWLEDQILPLKNPVGENITYDKTQGDDVTEQTDLVSWLSRHVLGSSAYGHTNMVPEFCRQYTEKTGRSVLAVHAAKGSTVIAEWLSGTDGYRMMTEKAAAAIKTQADDPGRIFFVWLQGESDAIVGNSKAYYKEKLVALATDLKRDLGIEKFGIIRVGRFTNDQRDLEIIAAQDELCKEQDDFLMLTEIATELCADPEYMNPFVEGHYSAKGEERLGYEAGKALAAFVNRQ